jgi:hypothetical protein
MRIKILDTSLCDSCARKTCAINDVIEKATFAKFRSERYCCPVRLLQYGPTDKQLDDGFIDISVSQDNVGCIYCVICKVRCCQNNLEIIDYNFDDSSFVQSIAQIDDNSPGISNILASLYLHQIFDFAANTNINKAMCFDGFASDNSGKGYFVEVDVNDDSLESCRRLLGDILTQNHSSDRKLDAGIMVLNHLPKPGSRDIFTLVEKIASFPHTRHLRIYATTFSLLRYFSMNVAKNQFEPSDILFEMTSESVNDYKERLKAKHLLSDDEFDSLF